MPTSILMTQAVLLIVLAINSPSLHGREISVSTPIAPAQLRVPDSILTVSKAGGSALSGGKGNTNLTNPFDVNDDGIVSPIDVLILINSINQSGCRLLSNASGIGTSGEGASGEVGSRRFYMDVDGDNFLSPLDVLLVINELNKMESRGSNYASPTDSDKPNSGSRRYL